MDPLHRVLRLNALSCLAFGLLFVVLPGEVAAFLGERSRAPAWAIAILGGGLVANGVALWAVSRQSRPARAAVFVFSAGDFAWVAATVVLIAAGVWIETTAGIVAALAVAILVGAFGALQLRALRPRPAR